MRKQLNSEKSKKLRLIRIVIVELIIMAVSVCVSIMPMPYRLIVPIIIGARSILLKAHQYAKSATMPGAGQCCVGTEQKSKTKKEQNGNAEGKTKDSEKDNKKAVRKDGKSKTK